MKSANNVILKMIDDDDCSLYFLMLINIQHTPLCMGLGSHTARDHLFNFVLYNSLPLCRMLPRALVCISYSWKSDKMGIVSQCLQTSSLTKSCSDLAFIYYLLSNFAKKTAENSKWFLFQSLFFKISQ